MANRRSGRSSNRPSRFKETPKAPAPAPAPEQEGIDEEEIDAEYSQELIGYGDGGQPPEVSREVIIDATDEGLGGRASPDSAVVVVRRTKKFGRAHKITFEEYNDLVALFTQQIEVLVAEVH